MSRGRAAAMPPPDHRRPPTLQGLVVTHINEKGDQTAHYDFATSGFRQPLAGEIAELFAARCAPTGPWRNTPTSRQYWYSLKQFAAWLAEQSPVPSRVQDLDSAIWRRWVLSRPAGRAGYRHIAGLAGLLRHHPELPTATRASMARRAPVVRGHEPSYSDDELRAISRHAKAVFTAAERRIRANTRLLERFEQGELREGQPEYRVAEILRWLADTGDVPVRHWTAKKARYVPPEVAGALGGSTAIHTWRRLYLSYYEMYCAAVLIACASGWNHTTICELTVPVDLGDPDKPVYSIQLEKRRRGARHRYETRTVIDDGPRSAGRLFTRILAATEPARQLRASQGQPTTRLLLSRNHKAPLNGDVRALIQDDGPDRAAHQWKADTGAVLNFRRIRKAVNVRQVREPNLNGRDVHDAIYVLSDPSTPTAIEATIAQGLGNAWHQADHVIATISTLDDPRLPDTATASCSALHSSPFTEHGVACSASFLLCLACPNAVVMPRHLGRLAHLHRILTELRGSLPPHVWARDWGAHHRRLDDLRRNHYTDAQWERAELSDLDRDLVQQLIRGELDA